MLTLEGLLIDGLWPQIGHGQLVIGEIFFGHSLDLLGSDLEQGIDQQITGIQGQIARPKCSNLLGLVKEGITFVDGTGKPLRFDPL